MSGVFSNLRTLVGYRALIQSMVVRDLKARYRGSVLGFLWSFVNPLLLLLIYSFVFTVVIERPPGDRLRPFALFMFCGILPWTWFQSTLLESSNVLIAGGNLIRKVLFPAEVLPIVTVLAAFVHFCLGLLILAGGIAYYQIDLSLSELMWLPVIVLVQLILTLALALLISVITVHFRDMRDLLGNFMTLWFFATPILYPFEKVPERMQPIMKLNPFTHLARAYQEVLFLPGPFTEATNLLLLGALSLALLLISLALFDRLRDTLPEAV